MPPPVYPHKDSPPSRYNSDPYTYLKGARELTSFYEAQWREPAFLFAVKTMLALMHDQDVAVSFTSVAFAVLAVWLTYVLGAALWSRPVGLLAALGLAIDRDAAWFSSQGWRDDAYVAAVIAGIYLSLRCWRRAREAPRFVHVGSMAIDVLYLEAGHFWAQQPDSSCSCGSWRCRFFCLRRSSSSRRCAGTGGAGRRSRAWALQRQHLSRRRTSSIAGASTAIRSTPSTFTATSIALPKANRKRAKARSRTSVTRLRRGPYATIDTIARGLTVYPFSNKWNGVDAWHKGVGGIVAVLAIAGMTVLVFVPAGRLVLFLAVASLLPFSLTWQVDPNWRFTAHVLPVLLIAAAVAVSVIARIGRAVLFPGVMPTPSPWMRDRTASSATANALAGAGTADCVARPDLVRGVGLAPVAVRRDAAVWREHRHLACS